MTRARVTWKSRPGPEGGFAPALPAIRAQYGDTIAEAVEECAYMVTIRRGLPTGQDVKHTLRAIAEAPASANLRRIDGWTEAELVTVAAKRYRVINLKTLPPDLLADCARAALARFKSGRVRTPTDDLAVTMIRRLLRLASDQTLEQHRTLVGAALAAVRLAHSEKTLDRLLAKARSERGATFLG